MSADAAWLVVGLGNPGPEYANTRHNIGFLVVEELASRAGVTLGPQKRSRSLVATGRLDGQRVILAQPQSFMNDSGGPTSFLAGFYSVPTERVIAVHDELDLPFGSTRVKLGGGDNGHNGLRSIRTSLGTGEWYRVRVGIDRPPARIDPASYVLKPWSAQQRSELDDAVNYAADASVSLMVAGLEATQNRYNR